MIRNKKYIIIGFMGAIIVGIASFIFLNDYLDREKILVMARDIEKGEVIQEEDICSIEFLTFYLPDNLLLEKEEVIGKTMQVSRLKNDFILKGIFDEEKNENIFDNLKNSEVLITLEERSHEPLLEEFNSNSLITIISTNKDIDYLNPANLNQAYYINNKINEENSSDLDGDNIIKGENSLTQDEEFQFLKHDLIKVVDSVFQMNGYLIVRNLKIIKLDKQNNSKTNSILLSPEDESNIIYIKCSLAEAFFISMITKDEDYKIIFEKI